MTEIWKDIQGYEGIYQISNLGRVKSFKKYKQGQILKPSPDRGGYLLVWLMNNGKKDVRKVHRLVGQHFLDNPNNLPFINHKDETPNNNRADNLEWCTQKYNNNYGTSTYRMARTLGKPVIQKTLDGKIVAEYYAAIEAERQTGIPNTHINACCKKIRKTAGKFLWEFAVNGKEAIGV